MAEGEKEPAKYWLSTLPEDIPFEVLVDTAKLRWRIERDYEELKASSASPISKGEAGGGFHHHAVLDRRQRFSHPRTSGDSPLRPPAAPNVSPILASQTQRAANPPERHVENSIATIRRQLTIALARTLMRCPCRQALPSRRSNPGSS